MSPGDLARGDLERRLAEAEATIKALLSGQIDAVVDSTNRTPVLLAKAQEAMRRGADELRHERDRAQRYLDAAEVILLALDADGRITLVNRYACSILEWTAAELLGRDWIATCLPARIRKDLAGKRHDLLRGDLSIFENPVLTKSGAERMIEWRNTLVRNDAGEVTGSFSSGTDITERSRAVEALRTAEERMRFALEAAGVGIWDMDYSTGELRWSRTLEAQYGLQPGTFDGKFDAFIGRVHPEDRQSLRDTVGAAMKTGVDFDTNHRVLWPDGTIRWLSGSGRISLGKNGEPVRGLGISQDVTESRALEQHYQQANKMEAVGRLASGVAHDFNNLLTVILGCADLMATDSAMASRHAEDLDEIIKAARRAAGLTKQLLAFGRQQVLHAAPLNLNALITDMTGMLDRLIGEHIEVALDLAPNLSLTLVDRSQLEQVMMNLVVNARDAMSTGGVVTIRTGEVDLEDSSVDEAVIVPGPYVMLAVTDTGTGMDKETRARLFEPFFTTKEPGKGTGLGLSTTFGIVKQSKGYIWVDSELGRGTTFRVYLPCSSRRVPVRAPHPVVPPVKRAQTILLVEDEAGVRRLAKNILETAGYVVLEAPNGDAAERLFALRADAIDLMVSDVILPGYSGPDLASRLRLLAPALRVLFMSGNIDYPGVRKAGIDRGVPFIQKPFTPAELVQQVRAVLANASHVLLTV